MPRKPWRIGLVGVGRGSSYGNLFASDPACEVVACCDADEAALARFQKELELPDDQCFLDYERFIDLDMDAVFIGTPIPLHAAQCVAALDAGVHVLSEVTAASTVEECGRIVDAVRRTGRTYMLAENCVYWPFVRTWTTLVESGRLGEIFYAECEYLHPIPELIVDPKTGADKWRINRAPLHYCSHSLGPILVMTGDRITHAMGLGEGHRLLPEAPVGGIDIQVALFRTQKNGIIKLLRTSVAPRGSALHFYCLQGTKGCVESDRRRIGGSGQLYVAGEMTEAQDFECPLVDPNAPKEAAAGGHGHAEYGVVQAFLRALETGKKPLLDVDYAMDICLPGLIAHDSAMRGGVWLEVPSL
jgi:predicted dehydrogenase